MNSTSSRLSRRRQCWTVTACTWLALLLTIPVAAQELATIAGTVRDRSDAVLPGVTVEVTSPALIEKVRTTITEDTGQYRIVNLPPGLYRVSFSLPGFTTQVRENIELRLNFTTPVNGQLEVGAQEETITVTGASPVVDVQTVTQSRALTAQNFAEIPSGGTMMQMTALVPGIVVTGGQDVGGLTAESTGIQVSIHGSRPNDEVQMMDGLKIGNIWVAGGDRTNMSLSPLLFDEVNVQVAGQGADAPSLGVQLNAVPKSGGNRFSGSMLVNGSANALQSDNLTSEIQALGLTQVNTIKRLVDINGALGGPLLRDRLWFFTTARYNSIQNNIAGMTYSQNPESFQRVADPSRPAYDDIHQRDNNVRITAALSPKQKITGYAQYQLRCGCYFGVTSTVSPEASTQVRWPTKIAQAVYSNTVTNQILVEGGFNWGDSSFTWLPHPEVLAKNQGRTAQEIIVGGLVPVVEQGGTLSAPITYRAPTTTTYNDATKLNRFSQRASVSYVTGTHNLKVGVDNTFGIRRPNVELYTGYIAYRTRDFVPNQITLYAPASLNEVDEDLNLGVYVQDRWTRERMTLSGGVRFDFMRGSVDSFTNGPTPWIPARGTRPGDTYPATDRVPNWKDINPRLGASYDLFGNGKTALKFSANRSVWQDAIGTTLANSPANTVTSTVNRAWTDLNRNFIPDCDLTNPAAQSPTTGAGDICGAYLDSTFGSANPSTTYDPATLNGWGARPWVWEFSGGVQHEVVPRVSVNAAYFSRVNGNFTVTDNLATAASNYRPITLTVPTDPRLPTSGEKVTGLYDVDPALVSAVRNQVTFASNYGKQIERWNGFDLTVDARPNSALYLQGGLSVGNTVTDNCAVVEKVPEALANDPAQFCHRETGYLPQVKALGAYRLPWDIRMSGSFQSVAGPQIRADVIYTAAQILAENPSLGQYSGAGAGQKTVNVIDPGTMYNDRLFQLDWRVTKIVSTGAGSKLELSADLYNALNGDAVLGQTNTYSGVNGGPWLRPTSILAARFVKFTVRFDF